MCMHLCPTLRINNGLHRYPTHQIVHVSSGEHVRPHVGVLVKEGVQ